MSHVPARLNEVNAKIRSIDPRFELVRGEGYHYVTFSDVPANRWESESYMIPYTGDLTKGQWIEMVASFITQHKGA